MHHVRLVVILMVSVGLVLVIAQNTAPIPGRFLWFSAELPAVIFLILTTGGGFILGLLAAMSVGRKKPTRSRGKTEGPTAETD